MNHKLPHHRVVQVLYIISSVVLLFLAVEAYIEFRNIRLKSAELNNHNQKRKKLLEAFNAFNQVETSTRGFLLLRDSLFLVSRFEGLRRYNQTGIELERSLDDNATINNKYRNLIEIFNKRLGQLDTMLMTDDENLQSAYLETSAEVLQLTATELNELISHEDGRINKLADDLHKGIYHAPGNVLVLSSIFILFLLISYFYLNRQLIQSKKLQSVVTESNKALSKNQAFLKSILDANPDGIIAYEAIRDDRGTINDFVTIFASGKLQAAQNNPPETLIGKKASELYPNLGATGFLDKLRLIIETGIPESSQVHYPSDGIVGGWYETRISKYNDGVLINGRNIDDIKKSELKLKKTIVQLSKSNDQLRQFAHITSHDLQEPLRKIQLFANGILDEAHINQKLKDDAGKIKIAAERLSALISSITCFTSLQTGATFSQLTDLNILLEHTLSNLDEIIKEKNAEIIVDYLPSIYCDPAQIGQLFAQLLSNSLKFNKNRPHISIKYATVTDPSVIASLDNNLQWIHLSISDNGIGFSQKYSHKLFNIFQRLHNSPEYHGTGIGLVICKQIVENHKGTITAYASENSGTIFDIYLPVDPEPNNEPSKLLLQDKETENLIS